MSNTHGPQRRREVGMSDIGDMIERGGEGPEWVERESNDALRKEIERLRADLHHCRGLLETACDAWECGHMVRDRDGVVMADWKAAMLPQAWHTAAKAAGGGDV